MAHVAKSCGYSPCFFKGRLEAVLRDEANDRRFILYTESPEIVKLARPLEVEAEAKHGKDYPESSGRGNAQAYAYDHET